MLNWNSRNLPASRNVASAAFGCKPDAMSTSSSSERARIIHVARGVLHRPLAWSRMVSSRVVKTYFRQFSAIRLVHVPHVSVGSESPKIWRDPRLQSLRDDVKSFSSHRDHRPGSFYPSTYSLPPFSLILFLFLQCSTSLIAPDWRNTLTSVIESCIISSFPFTEFTPYLNCRFSFGLVFPCDACVQLSSKMDYLRVPHICFLLVISSINTDSYKTWQIDRRVQCHRVSLSFPLKPWYNRERHWIVKIN